MSNTSVTTTAFDQAATAAALLGAAVPTCYVAPLKAAVPAGKGTTLAQCLAEECTTAGARVPAGFVAAGGVCTTVAAKFVATAATVIHGYFVATDDGMLIAVTMLDAPRNLGVGDSDIYTLSVA